MGPSERGAGSMSAGDAAFRPEGQQRLLHLIAGLIVACAPVVHTSIPKRQYTLLGAVAGEAI